MTEFKREYRRLLRVGESVDAIGKRVSVIKRKRSSATSKSSVEDHYDDDDLDAHVDEEFSPQETTQPKKLENFPLDFLSLLSDRYVYV